AGDGQLVQDLAVARVEDHHGLRRRTGGLRHRLRRTFAALATGGGRALRAAGGEQDVVLDVQREAVASAVLAERIVGGGLHRLHVHDRHAAGTILHHHVEGAFSVGDSFFGRAAEIHRANHVAGLRVNYRGVVGGVAENVNAVIVGVAVNAVRAGVADVNLLDQFQRRGVEHRNLGMAAGEAVAGARADRDAVAAGVGDFADRSQRVEIEDGDAVLARRNRGRGIGGGARLGCAAGNVEAAAGGIGEDVVPS